MKDQSVRNDLSKVYASQLKLFNKGISTSDKAICRVQSVRVPSIDMAPERDVELGDVLPAVSPPQETEVNVSNAAATLATGSAQAGNAAGLVHRAGRQATGFTLASQEPTSATEETGMFSMGSYCKQQASDGGYNSFAFLVWGSEDSERGKTWAVDVPLTDLGAQEKAFQQLAARYKRERGLFGSCFYLRSPSVVRQVELRIMGRTKDKFRVQFKNTDIEEKRESLRKDVEKERDCMNNTFSYEDGYRDFCWRNERTESYSHTSECPLRIDESLFDCPVQQHDRALARLKWWESTTDMSIFFREPHLARGHEVLGQPGRPMNRENNEGFIYNYRSLSVHGQSKTDERHVTYNGLFVTDAWIANRCLFLFGIMTVVFVVVCKYLLESWEAGSFYLGIPMLLLAILAYFKY
ncbi:hypothetical protein GE09DRAFT_1130073 [Coniochaeta sp. 2T2.1]|nr:hypothetical protein GE09DRAFT_1130073 [Coniochaeta sp. 2T2.1]